MTEILNVSTNGRKHAEEQIQAGEQDWSGAMNSARYLPNVSQASNTTST